MNKTVMIIAALAAIGALSVISVAYENHVRYGHNLDECVYYFEAEPGVSVSCYVPEENCEGKSRVNINKDVDRSTCYYLSRRDQAAMAEQQTCQQFTEGDLIVLQYAGDDPDHDIGPAGELIYDFDEPFDENNKWQTKRGDAGTYNVKVQVTDGEYTDETSVCFEILPGNHAPVLTVNDVTAKEGETVRLTPKCADEDGDEVTITFQGWMTTATKQLGYDDAGDYSVKVTCSDPEGESDTETVTVTVQDVDRAPTLNLGTEDVSVYEGETVNLRPTCTDPEGESVTIAYTGDMTSSQWKTDYTDAGEYEVTVTCTDEGGLSATGTVDVTVIDRNRPPTITAMVVLG